MKKTTMPNLFDDTAIMLFPWFAKRSFQESITDPQERRARLSSKLFEANGALEVRIASPL
jgi:hypothetical protein